MISVKDFLTLFNYCNRCLFRVHDYKCYDPEHPWAYFDASRDTLLREIPDRLIDVADFEYDMFVGHGIFILDLADDEQ